MIKGDIVLVALPFSDSVVGRLANKKYSNNSPDLQVGGNFCL